MSLFVFWASILVIATKVTLDESIQGQALLLGAIVVAILAFLAHQRSRRVTQEAHAVNRVDGWRVMETEIRRARRHGRRLSLCSVAVEGPRAADFVAGIDATLRADDTAFVSNGVGYFILPEADGDSALVAARRIKAGLSRAGLAADLTIATYPDDALTVSGLIDRLRSDSARRVSMVEQEETAGSAFSDEEL